MNAVRILTFSNLKSILIFPSYPRQYLPSILLLSDFPTRQLHVCLYPHACDTRSVLAIIIKSQVFYNIL